MNLSSVLLAAVLCSFAGFAHADITVNTGGNINCVTTKGESGFEALSFGVGGSQAVAGASQSGAGSSPELSTLNIMKNLDNCSAQLLTAFVTGGGLSKVTLTQYKTGTNAPPFPILTITLTNAFVSNYQISSGGQTTPSEGISFAYQTVCFVSTEQNANGSAGASTKVCYDSARKVVTQ